MTEEQNQQDASAGQEPSEGAAGEESQTEEPKREGPLRQGLGYLSAMKDAIEETISEARERGDLSTDRAKDAMKGALRRAGTAAGEARERFDFVSQREFDALAQAVADLEARVARLDGETSTDRGEGEPAP